MCWANQLHDWSSSNQSIYRNGCHLWPSSSWPGDGLRCLAAGLTAASDIWSPVRHCSLSISVSQPSTEIALCSLSLLAIECLLRAYLADIHWSNVRAGCLLLPLVTHLSQSGHRNICAAKLTDGSQSSRKSPSSVKVVVNARSNTTAATNVGLSVVCLMQ